MRFSILLVMLPLALGASGQEGRSEPAPLIVHGNNLVAGKFIVKFKEGGSLSASDDSLNLLSAGADHVFHTVFRGFAGKIDEATIENLRGHPDIEYIEQDSIVSVTGFVDQANATWGLGRVSHRKLGNSTYTYDDSAGEGTCSYVVDTGIDASHKDFGGRATQRKSFVDGQATDGNGHGTHCSGTIGSNTYGIAKKTNLYGVKVLDDSGSGSWSAVIAGMDYVATDYKTHSCPKGVFVNLSLEGGYSKSMNDAAAGLVKRGFFIGAAAGNSNTDVGTDSPGSEPTVCTVGATDERDSRSTFSNYGQAVDIFAPGSNIQSTYPGGGNKVLSGTSMATPHIVGLAAYLAALEGKLGGDALCSRIKELGTKDALQGIPAGTVNLLAFNGNPSG
ncbi:hypothetical protein JDV02_008127 [Purpureocillium takamizusanense]|uniref:Uncharacterized protein n=1 Tax=Purpureocillium takamizusanense TaxID=2060973 RepID=A0A9Q8VE19_9HYPO|nr:uncharacterized protein JDV02_008127 [Purpureocillium takamizusanense]UNI22218.1 hypothetical protein JDV02_008127 [Purpureocillium takamizusanense]